MKFPASSLLRYRRTFLGRAALTLVLVFTTIVVGGSLVRRLRTPMNTSPFVATSAPAPAAKPRSATPNSPESPSAETVPPALSDLAREKVSRDPAEAVAWALALESRSRDEALDCIVKDAALAPEILLKFGQTLLRADPKIGGARGATILTNLTTRGQYSFAVQFAADAPAELGRDWIFDVYARWARREPEKAVAGLRLLNDEMLNVPALQGVMDTWIQDDPATLARQAASMPADIRAYAFREASRVWSQRDPVAMAAWVQTLAPGPERDLAAAWLATARGAQ